MGKPKKEKLRREEVKIPAFGEKFRLLEIGKGIGKSLSLERLSEVLEEAKNVLLPLVQWLDRPLFPEDSFATKAFQKARGMQLYSYPGSFIGIWLERSGKWLVRHNRNYRRTDSGQLAKIMIQEQGYFWCRAWKRHGVAELAEKIPPIKGIASYHSLVLHVLSEFFKNVQEMLEDRQKRLNIMRKRVNLLDEFIQSLDPLVSRGKPIEMKTYSIFRRHENGVKDRHSDDFLCPEALSPIWQAIALRQDSSKFEEFVSEYNFSSLEQFLQRMVWIFEEIQKVRSKSPEDRAVGDRIALEKGELKAIKEAVNSITAG